MAGAGVEVALPSGEQQRGGVQVEPVVVAAEHDRRLQGKLREHAQPAHGRDGREQQPWADELAHEPASGEG